MTYSHVEEEDQNMLDLEARGLAVPAKSPVELAVEALSLVEDALSRSPFSTQIWPNGTHPNTGITKVREALAALQPLPVREDAQPFGWTWETKDTRVWLTRLGWAKPDERDGVRNIRPLYLAPPLPVRQEGEERERIARIVAASVRKINRVVAAGMHEGPAIYEAADAILSVLPAKGGGGEEDSPSRIGGETCAATPKSAATGGEG